MLRGAAAQCPNIPFVTDQFTSNFTTDSTRCAQYQYRDLFTVRTDSDIAQLNLIRAGVGIGMCQVQLADFSPPLQRIIPDFFAFHLDTWLVMHEDLRHSQACKTVFDFLAEGLQVYINRAKR